MKFRILILSTLLSGSAWASNYAWIPSPPFRELEAKLTRLQADEVMHKATIAAGKRAAFFCANCHGETGVSTLERVPNLAGQNPLYLLTQIDKFGDGRRQDEFMGGLVKVLKPEERFNIAVFYASQPVPPTPARDARLAETGAKLYARACVGCHGAKAQGSREVARLAGQRIGYVTTALKNYRGATGVRADPRMTGVAKKLSDQDINALAMYLASLP
jgi:cytochrome c553